MRSELTYLCLLSLSKPAVFASVLEWRGFLRAALCWWLLAKGMEFLLVSLFVSGLVSSFVGATAFFTTNFCRSPLLERKVTTVLISGFCLDR